MIFNSNIKRLFSTTLFLLVVLLTSCAVNSGVVQLGNDNYMVSRQAATGFSGLGKLKAEAMKEAHNTCQKTGKTVEIIKTIDSQPPYVLGNFPRTEVYFRCVSESELVAVPVSKSATSSGTGFGISSDGIIATNSHVVNGSSKITVRGVNGDFSKSYSAKLLTEDKNNDLAIIQITEPSFTSFGEIPFTIANRTSDVGSSVFAMGYPLKAFMGDEIKLTNGIISSKSGYQGDVTTYQISVPLQPGNSGGPLFDQNGNLVGIVNAKLTMGENVSYAVKSQYLLNLLDLLTIAPKIPTSNTLTGKSLTDQVKIINNFVYIIEVN